MNKMSFSTTLNGNRIELQRVTKTTAKKEYNNGTVIFAVPCKVVPDFDAMWIKPCKFDLQRVLDDYEGYPDLLAMHGFISRINAFEYYNCNNEVGNYAAFYIEVK